MATIPALLPLRTDAERIYRTSAPDDQRKISETVSNVIVHFSFMGSNSTANNTLYEQDFFEWTQATAALLRTHTWHAIDSHTLAEEIEDMGAHQYDAVSSAVYQVLVHLLKWRYQPKHQSNSWRASLVEHRNRIARKCRRMPSLAQKISLMIMEEYPGACRKASAQTGLSLSTFPSTCPWTEEQVQNDDFWPAETS